MPQVLLRDEVWNYERRLRPKDVDFDRQVSVVREAKGANDRVVMLPRSLHVLASARQEAHRRVHGPKREICILTANAGALRPEHLSSVGIARTDGLHILGLEQCQEWMRMFAEPDAEIDLAVIEQEVFGTALGALELHPGIRALVLECTDLPPYAAAIRRHSGLPIFDFISIVNYLHSRL